MLLSGSHFATLKIKIFCIFLLPTRFSCAQKPFKYIVKGAKLEKYFSRRQVAFSDLLSESDFSLLRENMTGKMHCFDSMSKTHYLHIETFYCRNM